MNKIQTIDQMGGAKKPIQLSNNKTSVKTVDENTILKNALKENLTTIKQLITKNKDTLEYYKIMTDISQIKVDYFIKYVKRDNLKKIYYGGMVDSVTRKDNGDYTIVFRSNNNLKWNLLLSRVFIFYREKKMTEIRQEEYNKWKEDMEKNHPEEYEEWKRAKKMKEAIKKKDPELYKQMYVHQRKKQQK